MSMRGAVAGCVVLACLVALLAERTEGHITFFSPKEMMLMKQEREGRKDMEPRSDEIQLQEVTSQQPPHEVPTPRPVDTVDIFIHVEPAHQGTEEHQKDK